MSENLFFRPDAAARREFALRQRLATVATLPGVLSLANVLEKVSVRIKNFHRLKTTLPHDLALLSGESSAAGNAFGSGFGYIDEAREIEIAAYYRAQIEQGHLDSQATESGAVYREAIDRVSAALVANPGITAVTNFGVSYG